MRPLFYNFWKNIAGCFRGYNLLWHSIAIVLTYIFVVSGLDWLYFKYSRSAVLETLSFPAVVLGGLLPIFVPLVMLVVGRIRKNPIILNTAWAIGQAGILGLIISDAFKAVTGRVPPEFMAGVGSTMADISRQFQFGFWRGGVFWGWPSTHTAVAFAVAMALVILYPESKKIRYIAPLYAVYIGLSASVSIHWFSEFIAGAIIGTIIGIVVGRSFFQRLKEIKTSVS